MVHSFLCFRPGLVSVITIDAYVNATEMRMESLRINLNLQH